MPEPLAFYNEHDPFAAEWLRELIRRGLVAPGVVDTRDIQKLKGEDLAGYTQVHLFAGIGGWSYALRLAGWPDDRPVWTGSCPCQPFSSAGRQQGTKDRRHLWPWMRHLLFRGRPPVALGEQVASGLGRQWLAGVRANLETLGYAVGAADLCAAGVSAPHIRQRLFWVADAAHRGLRIDRRSPGNARHTDQRGVAGRLAFAKGRTGRAGGREGSRVLSGVGCGLVNPLVARLEGHGGHVGDGDQPGRFGAVAARPVGPAGPTGGLSDAAGERRERGQGAEARHERDGEDAGREQGVLRIAQHGEAGFWSAFDLIPCRDGKARRVEPGTFPLAHGAPARVGRLRGYGNAIVPQVAAAFVRAWLEMRGEGVARA